MKERARTSVEPTEHWKRKRKFRQTVTDEVILLAITRGTRRKDSRWEGVLNATLRVPPAGRTLKVVYRVVGSRKYKIITAYWLD